MAYQTLALALRYAPQIGTPANAPVLPDTTPKATVPTLTAANEIHADAANETAIGFRRARLVDGVAELTGLALQQAKRIEAYLTSGGCLLAKGSIGKDAKATADELLVIGRKLISDLLVNREMWIGEGAAEEAGRSNPFVKARQVDDADPDFDFTVGTGDVPYSENCLWPESRDDL